MFKVHGKVRMQPNTIYNEYTQMVCVWGGDIIKLDLGVRVYNPSTQEAGQEDC